MVQSLNQGLDNKKFEQIEEMLALTIDPFHRKLDIKEMVEQYDYPTVDIEWMRTNSYY